MNGLLLGSCRLDEPNQACSFPHSGCFIVLNLKLFLSKMEERDGNSQVQAKQTYLNPYPPPPSLGFYSNVIASDRACPHFLKDSDSYNNQNH